MATAERAQAFGHLASASGVRSTAVGEGAVASGERSLSFGNLAAATATNSVAIGDGAQATNANQFVLGNAQNTYTTPGINSAESTAAQGAVVGYLTTDAAGNLAVDNSALPTAALTSAVQANTGSIAANSRGIASNARGIENNKEGIAMAMALDAPYVPSDRTFALSTGVGAFEGKTAFALNMGFRASDSVQFDAGLAHGFDNNQTGGRVGVTWAW
ncbi:hypothetical protein XM53_04465 [Roseovarius atlanticus]|uniref:Trimeric autotransporter adhesin YadA-like C-terminal membrane anchor domain-containing protein n=2 Tax=Roseovarius atlanticus TaxID=1641875 RepID=A0A0T5NY46_9RHOB|nr:hypothetical protein XM53_04465 [Roseovarius atlanticus]